MTFARSKTTLALLAAIALGCTSSALAAGSKLLATGGLTALGGAAGGGLATWALIAGYEADHEVGATTHVTRVSTPDAMLSQAGVAVGFADRFELSFAHLRGDLGPRANNPLLGAGLRFEEDVVGLKLRVAGKALYDQDRWLPQISVGLQFKNTDEGRVPLLLGARDTSDVDVYVSATKILLSERLLLNGTLRSSRGNQLGLLGFGGRVDDRRELELESSVAYLIDRRTMAGFEYVTRPNRLPMALEEDSKDLFVAYFPRKSVSCILGFVDLGGVANLGQQRGLYSSIQVGF